MTDVLIVFPPVYLSNVELTEFKWLDVICSETK